MNKYTPTLAQVRDFWASDGNLQPAAKSYEYGKGCTEFDRFIAKVKADAVEQVLELHGPVAPDVEGDRPHCHLCGYWPCDTYRAIEGAIND